MSLKLRFGAEVYYARTEMNLTQEQLAEVIGKSTRSIQYIEKGTFLPKTETALCLMNVLKIDPQRFEEELKLNIPDYLQEKLGIK